VAVNDIQDPEILMELLRHDPNYGAWPETIEFEDSTSSADRGL
jgi:glyceraldehyde-3-phosphate dehydrogenase/erythrose-4-phosphate dehydrogenase